MSGHEPWMTFETRTPPGEAFQLQCAKVPQRLINALNLQDDV
jgi:hypothetical protein